MAADKKPIVVAGRAYNSVEEMPAEVRRVYDLAVAAQNEANADSIKIVFNGREYADLDSMPEDVRKLYQNQQMAMETYQDFSVDATTPRAAKIGAPAARKMADGPSFASRYRWQLLAAAAAIVVILFLLLK
ncbi:MAG TPA: hypothetical protein VGT99_01275 [Gammaproteobacteria bacterium]|nr:hypothetical protein [Gammaproteobacteria bacterium]